MTYRTFSHALTAAVFCLVATGCDSVTPSSDVPTWDAAPTSNLTSTQATTDWTSDAPVTHADATALAPQPSHWHQQSKNQNKNKYKHLKKQKETPTPTKQPIKQVVNPAQTHYGPIQIIVPVVTVAATSDCSDSPCANGGRCLQTKYRYECLCPRGFTGPHCEMELQVQHIHENYGGVPHVTTPGAVCGDGACTGDEDGLSCLTDCGRIPGVLCAIDDDAYDAVEDVTYTAYSFFDCDGICREEEPHSPGDGACAPRFNCEVYDYDGQDCRDR